MRKFVVALCLASALSPLGGCATPREAAAAAVSPQPAAAAFADLSKRYLDGLTRLNPSYATGLGDHRYDDMVTDMSAAGRARTDAFLRQTLAALGRIDRRSLDRDDQDLYMIHDLSIHEAMPGHFVQIAHSNQNRSLLRAVLSSGTFVEGWAVYAEGMMADAGYLDGDPLFRLTVLKMRLRSITNSLIDIGIHTEGMTREQAMELMTRTGFQQEREAAGKWTRASLGSTQLPSYFVGYSEHMELREEVRRRRGASFDLKAYNDELLSHGSPPVRFVRALMLDEPIE